MGGRTIPWGVRGPGSYIYIYIHIYIIIVIYIYICIYIYYAQTPQFARTTVKDILKRVLNFNIQREHSACFNRVSRES